MVNKNKRRGKKSKHIFKKKKHTKNTMSQPCTDCDSTTIYSKNLCRKCYDHYRYIIKKQSNKGVVKKSTKIPIKKDTKKKSSKKSSKSSTNFKHVSENIIRVLLDEETFDSYDNNVTSKVLARCLLMLENIRTNDTVKQDKKLVKKIESHIKKVDKKLNTNYHIKQIKEKEEQEEENEEDEEENEEEEVFSL